MNTGYHTKSVLCFSSVSTQGHLMIFPVLFLGKVSNQGLNILIEYLIIVVTVLWFDKTERAMYLTFTVFEFSVYSRIVLTYMKTSIHIFSSVFLESSI